MQTPRPETIEDYDEESQQLIRQAMARKKANKGKSIAEAVLSVAADFRDPNRPDENPENAKLRLLIEKKKDDPMIQAKGIIQLSLNKGVSFNVPGDDSRRHAERSLSEIIRKYPLLPKFWEALLNYVTSEAMKTYTKSRELEYLLRHDRAGDEIIYNWQKVLAGWFERKEDDACNVFRQILRTQYPLAVNDQVRATDAQFINEFGTVTKINGNTYTVVFAATGKSGAFTREQLAYIIPATGDDKRPNLFHTIAKISGVKIPEAPPPKAAPPAPPKTQAQETTPTPPKDPLLDEILAGIK